LFPVSIRQALFIAPCSHAFHYKCLRPLLEQHHPAFSCPLCRTFADLEEDVEVEAEEVRFVSGVAPPFPFLFFLPWAFVVRWRPGRARRWRAARCLEPDATMPWCAVLVSGVVVAGEQVLCGCDARSPRSRSQIAESVHTSVVWMGARGSVWATLDWVV
ncbi:hypothetical protein B0H14DRAFT_2407688, partial [Mycena olivaceomarginata]